MKEGMGTTGQYDERKKGSQAVLSTPSQHALRDELEQAVIRDLLGPAAGPEEEITDDRVRDRYLLGALAPARERVGVEELDELPVGGDDSSEDGKTDFSAPQGDTMFPSSFGLSFCVEGGSESIQVTVRWGRYSRTESEHLADEKTGRPKKVWKRVQVAATSQPIRLVEGMLSPWAATCEQPEVSVKGLVRRHGDYWIVTLFLVNEQSEPERLREEAWLFQPELVVEAPDGKPIFRARRLSRDRRKLDPALYAEERTMEMLYRGHAEFAVGHGVAVRVEQALADLQRAVRISTRVVPAYEVPIQTPPTAEDIPALGSLVLDMKVLAETPAEEFAAKLDALPQAYASWIERQLQRARDPGERLSEYANEVKAALESCSRALERIREGISLIGRDRRAAEAFRFANKAMWMQRIQSIYAERVRRGEETEISEIDVPANRSWYPFQLGFILLNLPGVTDLRHNDRSTDGTATADLLWFATGGGKTEAYLGLAAYVMAVRRQQGPVAGRSGEHGVAVLMRYTLRLLTLQQFQRATALICACEMIRREALSRGNDRWGKEPFRIGLWVGQRTTPNRTEQSDEAVRQDRGQYQRASSAAGSGTPAQLPNCPWCGSRIVPGRHINVESFAAGQGRTITYCGDKLGRCPFSERQAPGEGLPVLVVDEEIYRRLPALLIATVDKFAQMPWNGAVQMLFGQVDSWCPRHGFRSSEIDDSDSHPRKGVLPSVRSKKCAPLRPPDLIIQDELHLISGPLGTLVGLYETAVDELATWEINGRRIRPKLIASTATIRRAQDQVGALFLRRVEVFPPQGLDAGDNFFSLQRQPSEAYPGRRYLGICAPGRRLKAVHIRVYVAFLAAAQQLYERYGKAADPWMTLVGYFNSMRELGGVRRVVDDDIRSRLQKTDARGLAKRKPPKVEELTSRKTASEIPQLLDRLEIPFDPTEKARRAELLKAGRPVGGPAALDVLLATNMVSVGVDVKRLGLMVVSGQPKTTAEYIQATSRVGRKAPGIVCTILNWARPRDLSHYETFEQYHATFYKHVEALSVTPFAPRALDRGLSALLVSLVRLAGQEFNENAKAAEVGRNHPVVQRAVNAIARRAEEVAGPRRADEVRAVLERRLDLWLAAAQRSAGGERLGYRDRRDGLTKGLLQRAGAGRWEDFTCLNSLRDVEPTVGLILEDRGLGQGGLEGGAAGGDDTANGAGA